jgi:hypothetical protein
MSKQTSQQNEKMNVVLQILFIPVVVLQNHIIPACVLQIAFIPALFYILCTTHYAPRTTPYVPHPHSP